MQKLTYSALFVIGVFAAFWIFEPDHQATLNESNSTTSTRPWAVLNTPVSSHQIGDKQNDDNLERSNASIADARYCNDRCRESMDQLRFSAGLTDDVYEELLGRTDELAAYLRQNPAARAEFLELASTADGDKRSVIMAVFNQLDINARWSLGEVLIESSDWHSRFDGINFLAQPDIMNDQLVERFSDMLDIESDHYVRGALIQAFNQPDKFSGNQEILHTLEEVTYRDLDDTVRGKALLVRVQLEETSEQIFYDSVAAIRSSNADYQSYGLRALEQIITRQAADELELSWINNDEAKYVFEELMAPEYDDMPADIRKEADNLYERYF